MELTYMEVVLMVKKLVSEECRNEVKKDGVVCLIDSGFGPRHIYEVLCNILHVAPEDSEFNSDWVDHCSELHEEVEERLNMELNDDAIYCRWNEDGDLLLLSEKEYIMAYYDDYEIQDELSALDEKITELVEAEKEAWNRNAENGEYDLDVLGHVADSDVEHVIFNDYYNHETENTVETYMVFDGEIETQLERKMFTSRENVLLDLITTEEINYNLNCVVKRDGDDHFLVYDTFYLSVYLERTQE